IATLHGPDFEKSFLERMQLAVLLKALDRGDLGGGDHGSFRYARTDGSAVDQHGAGAAASFAATILGSRQAQVVPQYFEERTIVLGVDPHPGTVDRQLANVGHELGLPPRSVSFYSRLIARIASSGDGVTIPRTDEKPARSRIARYSGNVRSFPSV